MFEILVIGTCLIVNALLAGLEIGFVSAPKPQLRHLAKSGSKEAQRILALRENPERTLSIIQIGITLVGAVAAAVGGAGATESVTPLLQSRFGLSEAPAEAISIILVVIPITYLSVVFGELVPKSLALRNPIRVSTKGARWLVLADRLLAPAVNLLEWSTKQVIRVFFRKAKPATPMPETTVEIDALAQHHQQAVLNLAHLERRQIKDILVPWSDVVFLRSTDSMEDIVPVVFASGHTRIPVKDNGNVVGILHTKEFLAFRENAGREWQSIIRPTIRLQTTDTALTTLRLMQTKRSHMAVAFSPAGELMGIVTMEDILEEFLGDVMDEDDQSFFRKVFADRVKGKMAPPQV
jgi:putative hemolysin